MFCVLETLESTVQYIHFVMMFALNIRIFFPQIYVLLSALNFTNE